MTPSHTQGPAAERNRASAARSGPPDSTARAVILTVNGDRRTVADGATIADLLRELDLDPRMIVVEHNGEILRRDAWMVFGKFGESRCPQGHPCEAENGTRIE